VREETALPASRAAAGRVLFAPGEYLTRFEAGAPHALRLDCRREKPGWRMRLPGGLVEPEFAGTAVLFEERHYEVVAAREVGGWVSYYLDPWDDAVLLRQVSELSPTASAREAAERSREQRHRSTTIGLTLLAPLVGLLPADVQWLIERSYGLPASRATVWSAVPMLVASAVILVLALSERFAGALGASRSAEWAPWHGPSLYFLIESLLRLGGALVAGEANGSLPVVALFRLVARVRRRTGRPAAPPLQSDSAGLDVLAASDQIVRIDSQPPRLEILSLLPKPHWSGVTGIHHAGTWYRLVETSSEARGRGAVQRFVLEEHAGAATMRGVCEYDPREVVELQRMATVARQATWVETFAPVFGLLDERDQRRLARDFDYLPEHSTGWSIVITAIFGIAAAGPAAVYLVSGNGNPFDGAMLLGGGGLVADSSRRAVALNRGAITPSWLAPPLRLLCGRLLDGSPTDATP
jgi:hypothetical protein